MASIGWPVERLAAPIDTAARELGAPPKLTLKSVRRMLGEVLSADGELARRKVFARRHVLVEMAPHLFGQDPRALDLLVGRALQDPEVIPLVGVAGAREQPHALASVLATEQAIADAIARQLDRSDAPRASAAAVDQAIAVGGEDHRRRPLRRAARSRRRHLHLGAGRRARSWGWPARGRPPCSRSWRPPTRRRAAR